MDNSAGIINSLGNHYLNSFMYDGAMGSAFAAHMTGYSRTGINWIDQLRPVGETVSEINFVGGARFNLPPTPMCLNKSRGR